jgi:hypothetical protein
MNDESMYRVSVMRKILEDMEFVITPNSSHINIYANPDTEDQLVKDEFISIECCNEALDKFTQIPNQNEMTVVYPVWASMLHRFEYHNSDLYPMWKRYVANLRNPAVFKVFIQTAMLPTPSESFLRKHEFFRYDDLDDDPLPSVSSSSYDPYPYSRRMHENDHSQNPPGDWNPRASASNTANYLHSYTNNGPDVYNDNTSESGYPG